MIGDTVLDGRTAASEAASAWLAFLATPAAPERAMSLLELDGYLTGVIVAPSPIRPGLWMAGLWADDEPIFDDAAQIQSVLGAVGTLFNALGDRIDRSLRPGGRRGDRDLREPGQRRQACDREQQVRDEVRGGLC